MQIDYIRRDVNEAISEDGGAFIQMVNKNTIGLKSSISEAKSALYVVGADSMIEGYFGGTMRSVFEGIREDGHPRTVGDVTFYPVCGGTFDLDKGWDPAVNDVRIKARLLNGVTLDVTDWTFRDVTEGRVSFTVDTISNGTTKGLVSTDKDAELNGKDFPAKEKLSVFWSCGTKGGEVPSDKFTANVARITIDKSVFASLTAAEDGKDITFVVKGCYNKATKSGILKYVAPAKRVVNLDAVSVRHEGESYTGCLAVSNPGGVKGYSKDPGSGTESLTAQVIINGGTPSEMSFTKAGTETSFSASVEGLNPGDEFKAMIELDPAKSGDYREGEMAASTIVS